MQQKWFKKLEIKVKKKKIIVLQKICHIDGMKSDRLPTLI